MAPDAAGPAGPAGAPEPGGAVGPLAGARSAEAAEAADPLLRALPGLLRNLAESGVVELEVSVGEARVYVQQRPGAMRVEPLPAAAGPSETSPVDEAEGLVPVAAPLSGVFYTAPAPDERAYVHEGDEVEPGQVVGLIEAMKVFNEIHAEVGGVVARVLVSSGQVVQAGQPLLWLHPRGTGEGAGDL